MRQEGGDNSSSKNIYLGLPLPSKSGAQLPTCHLWPSQEIVAAARQTPCYRSARARPFPKQDSRKTSFLMPSVKFVHKSGDDQLTEFLVLSILSNEIRALQRLLRYSLNNFLHRLDIPDFCLNEKDIYFVHLWQQSANRGISILLVDDLLRKHFSDLITGKVSDRQTLEGKRRMDHAILA